MAVLHWTYASNGSGTGPKEAVLGIHTTNPTACVHIQNRADTMVPFRIDNQSGTQILSLDSSGNLTLAGTLTSSGGGGSSSTFTTNLTMPTTYTASPNAASPTQYQLGYCREVKNSTAVSMSSNTVTTMAQIDITTGVWMIHGIAVFNPGTGVSTLGAAISGTTGVIDDYSQFGQVVANTNLQFLTVPVKYYVHSSTTAKTFYLVGLSSGGASNTNQSLFVNNGYQNMYSLLRAIRVG